METIVKSESEVIADLLNQEALNGLQRKWIGGDSITLHTADTLPTTELQITLDLAALLKGKLIFLKAENAWYFWDGAEYVKTEGDWFAHKVIKVVANQYQSVLEALSRRVNKKQEENEEAKLPDISQHYATNKKLQSAAALDAYAKLLKSELDEIPAELVKVSDFLGIEHLGERTTQVPFVTDFIPSVGIGQIYGESYTGKTYLTLDLALSICAGLSEWMGKALNVSGPCTVIYIAAEGGQPFWDAVEGWKSQHPEADLSGFKVLDSGAGQNVNITGKEAAPGVYGLEHLKAQTKAAGLTPSLVVFDPQANILSGVDENSNSEMIAALTPIQKWANEENFLALLVHHAGKKDTGSGRGASAQMGMMDLLVKLTNSGGLRTLSFDKVKGASKPQQLINFRLNTVDISSGSGKSAVVSAGDIEMSPSEKSFMETSMNRSKVANCLKDGINTSSKIQMKLTLSKEKVSAILDELKNDGRAQNLGSFNRPNWVLIGSQDDESVVS